MSGRLRFRSDAQYAIRDGGSIDLVEAGDDQIGLSSLQQGFVAKPRDADQGHTSGALPQCRPARPRPRMAARFFDEDARESRRAACRPSAKRTASRKDSKLPSAIGRSMSACFFLAYSGARADNDNSG
jgi:hypothetical protein